MSEQACLSWKTAWMTSVVFYISINKKSALGMESETLNTVRYNPSNAPQVFSTSLVARERTVGNRSRSLPFTLCSPPAGFGQQEKAPFWCTTGYFFITRKTWCRTVITTSISVARCYFQDSHQLCPMQHASFASYRFVCSEDTTCSWPTQSKLLNFLSPWQFITVTLTFCSEYTNILII